MKEGKLTGVAISPGNPELISFKALKVLQECDIIISPVSTMNKKGVAESILEYFKINESKIVKLVFPMVQSSDYVNININNINQIVNYLKEGKDVAFITIGDPGIYSTFSYVCEYITQLSFNTDIVPGINSFSMVAAKIKKPLVQKGENMAVISEFKSYEYVINIIDNFETVVFMKVSQYFKSLYSLIKSKNMIDKIVFISNCGLDNEKIYNSKQLKEDFKLPYLTIAILNKKRIS